MEKENYKLFVIFSSYCVVHFLFLAVDHFLKLDSVVAAGIIFEMTTIPTILLEFFLLFYGIRALTVKKYYQHQKAAIIIFTSLMFLVLLIIYTVFV